MPPTTATAAQLKGSGITFNFQYMGYVPVEASIHDMTPDLRPLVARECMHMLAGQMGLIPAKTINDVVRRVVGEPEIVNVMVDFNVSTKSLNIINSETNRLLVKHTIDLVSFASMGDGEIRDFFAYVGKKRDGTCRRCYILKFEHANQVMQAIEEAIELAINSQQHQCGPIASTAHSVQSNNNFNHTVSPNQWPQQHPTPLSTPAYAYPHSHDPVISRLRSDLDNLPCFHGSLTRVAAESLLQHHGDYLLRLSDNSPGQVILSGREYNVIKHMLLIHNNQVETRDRVFQSVSALIRHHQSTGAPIISDESFLHLIRALPRQ